MSLAFCLPLRFVKLPESVKDFCEISAVSSVELQATLDIAFHTPLHLMSLLHIFRPYRACIIICDILKTCVLLCQSKGALKVCSGFCL